VAWMTIVKSTVKGHIVIPTDIRRKYGIEKGTRFRVYEQKNKIIVEPLKRDSVQEGGGMLKTKGRF